jgi:hypothetical protein
LLEEGRRLLEVNYEGRFPYLEDRILETRWTYFQ